MRVINAGRNDHQIAIERGSEYLVNEAVCGRVHPRIVKYNPDFAPADEDTVVVQPVNVPPFDLTRTNRELINVNERRRVNLPSRIQNFAQGAPFIRMSNCAPDDDALDSSAQALAVRSHRREIFNRLRRNHSAFLGGRFEKNNAEDKLAKRYPAV